MSALWNGLKRRCPRCGKGRLYQGWYSLRKSCPECGLDFREETGDNFAFMYLSMAFLNGALFLGFYFFGPSDWFWKRVCLGAALVLVNALLLPFRKGLAVAIYYATRTTP